MSALPSDLEQLRDYGDGLAAAVRDAGEQQALSFDGGAWSDAAWRELVRLARTGREFSADDLIDEVGLPDSPGTCGATIGAARRAGLIRAVGYTTSRRVTRHGGVQRLWKGRT